VNFTKGVRFRYPTARVSAPILILDDDAVSRRVIAQALERAGLPCVAVTSGHEAMAWLRQHEAKLALLDLMMPPPDGYSVLRAIRSSEQTHELPVIVLTAADRDEEVTRAFEMGADDFLRKPFKSAELIARIRSLLRLREYVDMLARRERDARVVLELTQTLSSTLDFREILYTVVRRIADVVKVERCSIVLVRDEGRVGYVVAASDDRELRDLPIDLDKYPEIRKVLETGAPLIIDDAATDPMLDVVRTTIPKEAFKSAVCIPIVYEERPLGVLFLRSQSSRGPKLEELSLVRTVASATAIALRNARIMQSLRDQTRESTYLRFEAERRIRALEPYADFFHASADGILVVDELANVLFSNPRAREMLGDRLHDFANASFFDWLTEEGRRKLTLLIGELVTDAGPSSRLSRATDFEVQARGQVRTISVSLVAMMSEQKDDERAILLSCRDVTQERSTERELTNTKEFLERVIDSSVDAIISADIAGNLLLFNRAAERVFGYASNEVVGKLNVRELYEGSLAREIMSLMRSQERGGYGRLEGFETEVRGKQGERIPVLISAALIIHQGVVVGSVGVLTDLRERRRMQAKLDAAQEELRNREKESLIAELAGAAAHELNQPLTSVLGYAEIISRRAQAAQPHLRETEALVREAQRMAEIVRKVGKITKYETKAYVGEAKIIDLDRSVEDDS
jgi:PAS domain S-box-containing protein